MKQFFCLVVVSVLCPLVLLGKDIDPKDYAHLRATSFARKIVLAKDFKALSHTLSLSKSDKKLFEADFKRAFKKKSQPLSIVYKDTTIRFGKAKDKVEIDFRDISKKVLRFNNVKIDIRKKISYMKALVRVRDIRRKKSAVLFDLFISEAHADESGKFDPIYAALISSESNLTELSVPSRALEETLIQTYRREITYAADGDWLITGNFGEARKKGGSVHVHRVFLLNFTCENDRLKKIVDGIGINNGRVRKKPFSFNYLDFNPSDNTYSGEVFLRRRESHFQTDGKDLESLSSEFRCKIQTNQNGEITLSQKVKGDKDPKMNLYQGCPEIGENIFEIGSTFQWYENGEFVKSGVIDTVLEGLTPSRGFRGTYKSQTLLTFGEFPKVADTCCKKRGCYEKVQGALDQMLREYEQRVIREEGEKSAPGTSGIR